MQEAAHNHPKPHLLIVDDDIELCELASEFLQVEGFDVTATHDGEQGLQTASSGRYDLVLLDVMLPGINGFEVLRRLRANSGVPVLMLTARGEDIDRVVGLELGADDYLPKPFNTRELVARIHAILRRTRADRPPTHQTQRLVIGDVELDEGTRQVRRNGEPVELTGVEFNLLKCLLESAGRLVTRDTLFKQVLGRRSVSYDRSLDMHISNLRRKLGRKIGAVDRIKTLRGHGYIYTLIDARSTDDVTEV